MMLSDEQIQAIKARRAGMSLPYDPKHGEYGFIDKADYDVFCAAAPADIDALLAEVERHNRIAHRHRAPVWVLDKLASNPDAVAVHDDDHGWSVKAPGDGGVWQDVDGVPAYELSLDALPPKE